jgi:HAD superfamily hydrolase (TIGR01509 family)
MENKINTFIFDCFGVILRPVVMSWYEKHLAQPNVEDTEFRSLLRDFDLGKVSEIQMTEYLSGRYPSQSPQEIREEIDNFLNIDRALVNKILELKSKGHKLVLLSNANGNFFTRKVDVVYPEFKKLFDELIISSEVGMVKPDQEIFIYTLEKANVKPENCLFIDDGKKNIDVALTLGINSYLYTDFSSFDKFLKENSFI